MWFIRFKRIFLILVIAMVVILAAKKVTESKDGESRGWVSQVSKNILGAFTKNEQPKPEFVNQQVDLIKNKLDQLLQELKKMPAEEVQSVKKKVIGDFCQKLLEDK